MTYQIIYLMLVAVGLGVTIEQYGKPKTGTHTILSALIATALCLWLQYMGGFYDGFFK